MNAASFAQMFVGTTTNGVSNSVITAGGVPVVSPSLVESISSNLTVSPLTALYNAYKAVTQPDTSTGTTGISIPASTSSGTSASSPSVPVSPITSTKKTKKKELPTVSTPAPVLYKASDSNLVDALSKIADNGTDMTDYLYDIYSSNIDIQNILCDVYSSINVLTLSFSKSNADQLAFTKDQAEKEASRKEDILSQMRLASAGMMSTIPSFRDGATIEYQTLAALYNGSAVPASTKSMDTIAGHLGTIASKDLSVPLATIAAKQTSIAASQTTIAAKTQDSTKTNEALDKQIAYHTAQIESLDYAKTEQEHEISDLENVTLSPRAAKAAAATQAMAKTKAINGEKFEAADLLDLASTMFSSIGLTSITPMLTSHFSDPTTDYQHPDSTSFGKD
jgi:hypothetical protein